MYGFEQNKLNDDCQVNKTEKERAKQRDGWSDVGDVRGSVVMVTADGCGPVAGPSLLTATTTSRSELPPSHRLDSGTSTDVVVARTTTRSVVGRSCRRRRGVDTSAAAARSARSKTGGVVLAA